MKKLTVLILIVAVLTTVLGGCSSVKLSENFDQTQVEAKAKQVIEALNSADYDSVRSILREDLQEKLTSETLKSAVEQTFLEAGSFQDYKSITVIGQKDKTTDDDVAVAVVVATYEKQKVTFTLSFDTNLNMVGIYMK